MFQADLSMKGFPYVLGFEAESVHGGDVALNSLLITSLSLKLPLKNPTALKNREMAKLRVSFS